MKPCINPTFSLTIDTDANAISGLVNCYLRSERCKLLGAV